MPIKINLSRVLGERRIKITEFAEKACIAKNTVMALYHEKGKGVTWDVLEKICIALNCQPGDLIEYIPSRITFTIKKSAGISSSDLINKIMDKIETSVGYDPDKTSALDKKSNQTFEIDIKTNNDSNKNIDDYVQLIKSLEEPLNFKLIPEDK